MDVVITIGWLGLLSIVAGYNHDRILMQDVKVLTLHNGQMTNGRRSSPVPQLTNVGGEARGQFRPQTVQCHSQGSDGYSTQWECKADMDAEYRFGKVEVTCEGYDYPEDPYILRGSCGLEYTLEYTKGGYQKQYGNQDNYYSHSSPHQKSSGFSGIVTIAVVVVIAYFIYKKCLSTDAPADADAPPPYQEHQHATYPPSGSPPPPGFKPNYTSGSGTYGQHNYTQGTAAPGAGGGGFWSGAATGGLLGYLFGRNNNYAPGYTNQHSMWNQPSQNSFWSSGSSRSSGSVFGSGASSGTRTASGFGGTKRR